IMERDLRVTSLDLINNQADYNFVDLVPYQTSSSATAYVTIIKGCNNFCSYCIVPYVRGREVSRPMDEIVDEIKKLVSNGVREVILLGQNVNSYADRLDNKNHCTSTVAFIDLIRGISQKTNVDRIRFMSPHPKDLSDELIEEYGCNKKLCRHIHLPVQAGSNKILDAMNRRYTREHYISLVEKLQKADPSIAITTDMICGFPGESKDDFRDTLDLVKRARFHNMYAFVYSPRPGTKAADLEDNVSKDEKSERLQTLLELQSGISKEINLGLVGKTVDLLVEGQDRMQSGQLMGRTTQNKIVNFSGQMELVGNIVSVEILRANVNSLEGILSS
ncbi:tRNA (N6-isopentenyl adenosine(37)-C2)-methylthiotransferase MiaB, partial [bacterium]|nr:tRNA (N6-isopentenyl adenosine(37)-C2)-methylthiotransferase MiaB [bacterium]